MHSMFDKVTMNNELATIFSENPRYKAAYYEFLEINKNNYGKDSTKEQLEIFEECYARDFLNGIKNQSSEREELIRGKRILIRKAHLEDADFMHAVELDEENTPWIGNWPLGWRIAKFGDKDFLQTIIEKEDGTPIGIIIFCDMLHLKTKLQLKRIAILEKGKGYGREALYLAQKLAFEVLGTKHLYLGTKENNLRAQSIYKATGFIPDMPDPCTQFYITNEVYKNQKNIIERVGN